MNIWVASNQIACLYPVLPPVDKSCCEEGFVCHSTQNIAPASQNWLYDYGKAKRLCFVFPSNTPLRRLLSLSHLDRPLWATLLLEVWFMSHIPLQQQYLGALRQKTLRPYAIPPETGSPFFTKIHLCPWKLEKLCVGFHSPNPITSSKA